MQKQAEVIELELEQEYDLLSAIIDEDEKRVTPPEEFPVCKYCGRRHAGAKGV